MTMDSISKSEVDAPSAEHIQDAPSEKRVGRGAEGIKPIDEEALEDVQHIDLGWRSWVRTYLGCSEISVSNQTVI